jgi:F0F1-type ATP synthase assembly protein I
MSSDKPKRIGSVWQRASSGREASAGYDIAANILVGLGLGWLLQRFFPGLKPWGYAGGIILGAISGFYQLFKTQQPPVKRSAHENDKDHAKP